MDAREDRCRNVGARNFFHLDPMEFEILLPGRVYAGCINRRCGKIYSVVSKD
jgi:hypothetical protein